MALTLHFYCSQPGTMGYVGRHASEDLLAEDVRGFMKHQILPTDVMPSIRMFQQARQHELLGRITRRCGVIRLARHTGIRHSTEPIGRDFAVVVEDIQTFVQQQASAGAKGSIPRIHHLKQAGKRRLALHVAHHGSRKVARAAGLNCPGRGPSVREIAICSTLNQGGSLDFVCWIDSETLTEFCLTGRQKVQQCACFTELCVKITIFAQSVCLQLLHVLFALHVTRASVLDCCFLQANDTTQGHLCLAACDQSC